MARFVRNSVLRNQGTNPNIVLQHRARARRAESRLQTTLAIASNHGQVLTEVAQAVAAVKTPNGTTKKIARLLEGVA